jgi:hypothetical protein
MTARAAIVMIGPHPTKGIFESTSVTRASSLRHRHRTGCDYATGRLREPTQTRPNRDLPPERSERAVEIVATGIPNAGVVAR